MSAIDQLFQDLRKAKKKAFMPFVTAGDPSLDLTGEVIRRLDGIGCHLCEVGIPYSDPIADGPVIQASYTRALAHRIKLKDILQQISQWTGAIKMPLITMVSYAIVYRHGLERYVDEAKSAGISGLIIPDLPVEEAERLAGLCVSRDVSLVQLITPTTSRDRAIRIANTSTGFIYYVSVTGITGERQDLPPEVVDQVAWLRDQTELPICIGFGISRPEHVQMLKPVADGIIVGSAFVRHLSRLDKETPDEVLDSITQLADSLLRALND